MSGPGKKPGTDCDRRIQIKKSEVLQMNDILAQHTELANTAELYIEQITDGSGLAAANRAGERFLRSAKLLGKGGFLGWQLTPGSEGMYESIVFSDGGSRVDAEDYNWIFDDCASAEPVRSPRTMDLCTDNRQIYMLARAEDEEKNERGYSKRDRCSFIGNTDDEPADDDYGKLFDMLESSGAAILLTAGLPQDGGEDCGRVIISLPDEMSLRMRSLIRIVFPGFEAVRKDSVIPDRCFIDCAAHILNELMVRKGSRREEKRPETSSGREALDSLIGLEEVKAQVKRIEAYAKMKRDLAAEGAGDMALSLNMEFTGNPGTAKTTVARIMAGLLCDAGLLDEGKVIEAGRADLVAKYEGQTAVKVRELFQKAKGRVLFIDEAYSLAEDGKGRFGDEAINTIVQEMENNRNDTVVIFAGYPDRMEEFFGSNPGLRSRVPFRISFRDYTAGEMLEITELEARRRGFSIDMSAYEKVRDACAAAAKDPESGNGRFCRNLAENAILNFAARIYGGAGAGSSQDAGGILSERRLLADDFEVPRSVRPDSTNRPKQPIGFRA